MITVTQPEAHAMLGDDELRGLGPIRPRHNKTMTQETLLQLKLRSPEPIAERLAPDAPHKRADWLTALFTATTNPFYLGLIAAPPLIVAAYLLLSPGVIFSREMSWDLLFNLEGAWSLYTGQTPHVDFHDPLGILPFLLTEIGFWLNGIGPWAFMSGVLLFAGVIFVASVWVIAPRLPIIAAGTAVIYLTLLVLVPSNLGDDPLTFTFAMSYDRFGWSALFLLFLLLIFPAQDEKSLKGLRDPVVGLLLLLALFYLKITYFLVGFSAIAVALVISPPIQRARWRWLLVLGGVAAVAAGDLPYWNDIILAVQSGAVRHDVLRLVKSTFTNNDETALLVAQLLCLLWLQRKRLVSGRVLVIAFLAVVSGLFVMSQNAQAGRVPLYLVISFLLFERLRSASRHPRFPREARGLLLLAATLVPPALAIAAMTMTVAGYWRHATPIEGALFVGETNLHGLAVPADNVDLLDAFAQGSASLQLLTEAQRARPRWGITQAEYTRSMLEAAALFDGGGKASEFGAEPRIMILDAVNPLPFALGFPPPRGAALWLDASFPWPTAERELGDVDVVLIPKFFSTPTQIAVARYGGYLHRHFALDRETRSWLVYRRNPARTESDRN